MSVIVTANYKCESFEVEIFRDGSLWFPERDFEHEQTLASLGGDKSIAIRFDEVWARNPTNSIFKNINLPENSAAILVADCAEHVLPIYERKYPVDRRPRDAVDMIRKFIIEEIDLKALKEAARVVGTARIEAAKNVGEASWAAWAAAEESERAAWTTARAAETAAWGVAVMAVETLAWAADAATEATAYNVSSDRDSVEWQQARDAEIAWQVRRFVDCMESVGQGLPWPDLEATQ